MIRRVRDTRPLTMSDRNGFAASSATSRWKSPDSLVSVRRFPAVRAVRSAATCSRSRAICAGLADWASRLITAGSLARRASNTSWTSCTEGRVTKAPRFGRSVTIFS